MNIVRRYIALLCCVFCFVVLSLSAEVQYYEGSVVETISIVPHNLGEETGFDTTLLLSQIQTKEGLPFSQDEFDIDLKVLAKDYAQVEPSLSIEDGELAITINLWPKPLIHSIKWKGNEDMKTSKLRKELDVDTRSVYDPETFLSHFRDVQNYYIKKGYFEADLSFEVAPLDDSDDIDIIITVKEGRSGKIQKISFQGITSQDEKELLELIHTQKYDIFTSWYTGKGVFNQDAVDHDTLIIVNYLQNEGHADATVDINLGEVKDKHHVEVTITIEKGERYFFDALSFSGNSAFTNETILSLFVMPSKSPHSPEKIRETAHAITTAYGKRGYIDATVTPMPRLHEHSPTYSVHFSIEEGAQYRVGLIKVFGNMTTHAKVILHESLLVPGDTFNIEKLRKTEERLYNVGYFSNVTVYPISSHESSILGPYFRDVHIEVEETSTGSLGFSLGFSSSESLFGGIDIVERNFNIAGFPRLFTDGYQSLRGGGEYAHLRMDVGTKQRSYLASWTKPYFLDSQWTVGFDLSQSNNRAYSDDYDVNSIKFGINGLYTINQFLRCGCHYRLHDSDITVKADDPTELLIDQAENSGLVSAIGLSFNYDNTDSPHKPREGFRSSLSGEYAGIGGDFFFWNFSYLNSYYYPLTDNGIMKYRFDFNFIVPTGSTTAETLPIAERLFLGGEDSIRGYRYYSLGPKYANGDARGGISSTVVSLEYLHTLSKKFDAFLFLDAGHVSLKEFDIGRFRTSVGAGLLIEVFPHAPPLAIGWGFPIKAESRSEIRRFFISLGARF